VNEGEVVTCWSHNGANRTTTMRAIVGLTGTAKGSIKDQAKKSSSWPLGVARLGLGYCPRRGIFACSSAPKT
jgi:branched-chain amino acid transport system ATP-binding protein